MPIAAVAIGGSDSVGSTEKAPSRASTHTARASRKYAPRLMRQSFQPENRTAILPE